MKYCIVFLFVFSLISVSYAQDYTMEWQEVDASLQKRLPKSAYEKAQAIFEKSIQTKNQEQITKSILYLQNLSSQLEEITYDSRIQKEIKYIETQLPRLHGGARSILLSFLATKYAQYLDQNYWKIKDRTRNASSRAEDLTLWTLEDVESKTLELYLASIQDSSTKSVPIATYKRLISHTNSKYCQTLYDFLVRRALEALSNERHYMSQPMHSFQPTEKHFAVLTEFVNTPIPIIENSSKKYTALRLFQLLLKEHINDVDPTILIDIELQRLEFVYSNYEHDHKEEQYKQNLNYIFNTYRSHSESYYALIALATVLRNEGDYYVQTKDSSYQGRQREAIAVCEKIIAECSDPQIVAQAKNKINTIRDQVHFSVTCEKVYLPHKPLIVSVNYTSIDRLYYRIYPKNIDLNNLYEYFPDPKDYFKKQLKQAWIHQGSFTLRQPGDFFSHSTELDLPPLDMGTYTIVFSKEASFDFSDNMLQGLSFSVSNLAYFHHRDPATPGMHLYVVDRNHGQPQNNVEVKLYQSYWTQKREAKWIQTLHTNIQGHVYHPWEDYQNNNYFFVIRKDKDVLYELQEEYLYKDYSYHQDPISDQYALFLDREIYRPEQTIYFKGIAFQSSPKTNPKILSNKDVEVIFRDANYQEIARKNLKTNTFGSFHSSFTAPKAGLLGKMSLMVNNNTSKEVRVEEYKRPSFEIIFDTFRQQAQLGQNVRITGAGKAYTGAKLPYATIKYRVTRQTRYPYWRCWWIPMPNEDKQIAFGETKTDENGTFSLNFTAESGKENPWDKNPIFQYDVHIEMTDITGEMQMGTTSISIGKVDFQLDAEVKDVYAATEEILIPWSVRNLNGQSIDKDVHITLTKLVDPAIVYQTRYWEKPDLAIIPEAEFRKKFPSMPYGQEDRIENYTHGPTVYVSMKQANAKQGIESLRIEPKNYKAGAYKLSLQAKDQLGKVLQIDKYFNLADTRESNRNKPMLVQQLKAHYQPGQKTNILLAGSQDAQRIWYSVIRKNGHSQPVWSESKQAKIVLDIREEDRGGSYILWNTVLNNRMYSAKEYIHIPYTNKELDIEYLSFRDKLAPGQQEEWRIKIKGPKGDKVMAEVLANMYDQSLDVFAPNRYSFFPYSTLTDASSVLSQSFQSVHAEQMFRGIPFGKYHAYNPKIYPSLTWQDHFYADMYGGGRGVLRSRMAKSIEPATMSDGAVMEMAAPPKTMATSMGEEAKLQESNVSLVNKKNKSSSPNAKGHAENVKKENIQLRKNLNETVFFLPQLMTDSLGHIVIQFKMNEALTKWKFMALATSQDLQIGISEKSVVTQKDLMIQANPPRFIREKDEIYLSARVTNLTDKKMTARTQLELIQTDNQRAVEDKFGLANPQSYIDVEAGQTKMVEWKLKVPEDISALTYRVFAQSGNFSDGEENTLPVLSNRMLVTETMPFHVKANSIKSFDFNEMSSKFASPSLRSKVFTLEYTSNPVWFAVQSLPYLMEYPYECTEQIFSRYFANSLSSHLVQRYPKIQSVFESWKGTDAMLSQLTKNQDLKSALLEETPWVLDAQSEEEQKKNIGVLFDLVRISREENSAIEKLSMRQSADGSFPWFPGGHANPYMTQYVLEGLGHLNFLGVRSYEQQPKVNQLLERALQFADNYIVRHYEEMKKWVLKSKGDLKDDHLDPFAIHYLYMRSFFDKPIPAATKSVWEYYNSQGKKYWTKKSMYQQGMLALHWHRNKDISTTPAMMQSFRERAKINEEKGMYWDNEYGFNWYELPIETHSLMTEVFEYLSDRQEEKDNLKLYLLKNKQTNRWKTTKATASAIYAILGGKQDRLDMPQMPTLHLGEQTIDLTTTQIEKGTGYFKKTWKEEEIQSNFSKLHVVNPNPTISWGSLYWQYLETMNAIQTNASSPLKLMKKLYVIQNTEKGKVLIEASPENVVLGSKLRIRLTLMVEREMEFLHLKDMRASGLEPVDNLSGYKWTNGLGYYQTTRDASMNFFIDKIYKGTYTIEYDLKTNLKGRFSNGIATFQSMYAPEYNSHSQGQEVIIK